MLELIFAVSVFIGALAHYLKKYVKGETKVQIYEWFGRNNLPATILSFITIIFAIVAALGFGLIVPGMSVYAVMYTGFLTGYSIDSSVNSDGILAVRDSVKDIQSKL